MLLDGVYHLLLASVFIVIFDRLLHMSGEAVPWLTFALLVKHFAFHGFINWASSCKLQLSVLHFSETT